MIAEDRQQSRAWSLLRRIGPAFVVVACGAGLVAVLTSAPQSLPQAPPAPSLPAQTSPAPSLQPPTPDGWPSDVTAAPAGSPAGAVNAATPGSASTTSKPAPIPADPNPLTQDRVRLSVDPADPKTAVLDSPTAGTSPGDVRTNKVTISNDSTVRVRFSVRSITSDPTDKVADVIRLIVFEGSPDCATPGAVVYDGALGSARGITVISAQEVAPGAQYRLCMRTQVPTDLDNSFQGLSTRVRYEFIADATTT